jgi:RNA polymerase sigma-70 factor, ECF subfamily
MSIGSAFLRKRTGGARLTPDEQIIGRVLRGHTDEYRELMLRYQNSVFRLAFRILSRREEAEDVVQETFLRGYSKLASCRERDKFWPWIRRIALNLCLRRNPREYPCDTLDALAGAGSTEDNPVEAEVIRRVEMDRLKEAVAELPASYRTVLVLRHEEDLAYKEIAELVGANENTVRTRLHRARKLLAERLAVVTNEMC